MGTQTYSFSVQLSASGRIDVYSWQATYTPTGRQLPEHRSSAYDVDASYLSYLCQELADQVIRDRRQLVQGQLELPF